MEFGQVADAGLDQLDRMVRTNLRAPYALTQAALPLLGRSRGDVVFVNSSAGVRPSAGVAAYGARSTRLRGFADALRDEVNPLGIRVTSVYPGRTHTPMQASVYEWRDATRARRAPRARGHRRAGRVHRSRCPDGRGDGFAHPPARAVEPPGTEHRLTSALGEHPLGSAGRGQRAVGEPLADPGDPLEPRAPRPRRG